MDQIRNLNKLNLKRNVTENWKQWLQRFELYLKASGITTKSWRGKCLTLLYLQFRYITLLSGVRK